MQYDVTWCEDCEYFGHADMGGEGWCDIYDTATWYGKNAMDCPYFKETEGGLVMKYICKEGFSVERYDDDGWSTDTYMNIEVGEVYEVNDDWHRVAGGYDSIRLENNENGNWLELQQETVDQYFEPAEGGET